MAQDGSKYRKAFYDLLKKYEEKGIVHRFVKKDSLLKDFRAMNRVTAAKFGFPMPEGVDILQEKGHPWKKMFDDLAHEGKEMYDELVKRMKYWPAHVDALIFEGKAERLIGKKSKKDRHVHLVVTVGGIKG